MKIKRIKIDLLKTKQKNLFDLEASKPKYDNLNYIHFDLEAFTSFEI